MLLKKFDVKKALWTEDNYSFPRTLAEAMFPEISFAFVSVGEMPRKEAEKALSTKIPNGFELDFATGSKKKGDFVITNGEVASYFWDTPEESTGYGSNLLTSCWGRDVEMMTLNIRVVEDGEAGTGDCHAKVSMPLMLKLEGDFRLAAQFRMGSPMERILAKGTFSLGKAEYMEGYDMILPRSAFKSTRKPEVGAYTWETFLGVYRWSSIQKTRLSWQALQWFSWETIEAELLPLVEIEADNLLSRMAHIPELAAYLHLDSAEFDLPVITVMKGDVRGMLSQHPYIIHKIKDMLRRRWKDLAQCAGQKFVGLMALPDDSLPLGVIATDEMPMGKVISTRFPLRYWGDVQIWKNRGIGGIGPATRGTVYMSHETAAVLGGDFDGDYFQFASVEDYPLMTKEIRTWRTRPVVDILKVKERLASPMDKENTIRVMLDNAENKVGQIALLVARAVVHHRLDLVPKLAQELQIAVDKFKYNLEHDNEFLIAARGQLPQVEWIENREKQWIYYDKPHPVSSDDTIGKLIAQVNQLWEPVTMMALELVDFAPVMPKPDPAFEAPARAFNAQYANLIHSAAGDKDKLAAAFKWLHDYVDAIEDKAQWAIATWHATHRPTSGGRASLPFVAFPSEIAAILEEVPLPEKVSIVGAFFNAYKDAYPSFKGLVRTVDFQLKERDGKMRIMAHLDGKPLGYLSRETPMPIGQARMSLTTHKKTVYATPA